MSKGKDVSAFPYAIGNKGAFGMTLRDYFAAKAMQSLLQEHGSGNLTVHKMKYAYEIADMMLEARK